MTRRPEDTAQYSEPDPGAVPAGVGLGVEVRTAELLALCEEFFRTVGPAVHDELRTFLTGHGHHPVTGLGAFIDGLGFTALLATATTAHSPNS